MRKDARKSIEVPADIEGFKAAQTFASDLLERSAVSREVATETLIIFETVFDAMFMQGIDRDTTLTISAENRISGINLKISYEGERFILPEEGDSSISLENRLLEGYADKVSHSYRSGYNIIRVSVQKKPRAYLVFCGVALLAAIATYAIINMVIGHEEQWVLLNEYLFPFEQLYANAMLMVGAPVTFFSLLKNSSDAVVVSERILDARKWHIRSLSTSALTIVLALVLGLALTFAIPQWRGYGSELAGSHVEWSFAEMVVSIMPASIFEPFETLSPVPLIIIALLVTYALVSAGKDFDILKRAIEVCYGLFSRVLSAIMVALPIFYFLAVLDLLIRVGYKIIAYMLVFLIFAIACSFVLLATYAVRLKVKGINIGSFVKELPPLLRENRIIGSVIDANPYNVRYCVKHFGMDRSRISRALSLLAQINRDANCFFLMLITMLYIFASGTEVTVVNVVVIAAIALFLSFGAPNQPGSILIGTLIIVNYLNSYDVIGVAICLEVFLGGLQNMVNVIGNIVMVAEEEGVQTPE